MKKNKIISPAKKRSKSPSKKSVSSPTKATKKKSTTTTSSPSKKKQIFATPPSPVVAQQPQYMSSPMRKKLHLVIDLDATFVSTVLNELDTTEVKKNIHTIEEKILNNKNVSATAKHKFKERFHKIRLNGNNYNIEGYTILRPYTYEFLEFANSFFKNISIWTAGNRQYAEKIANILFPYDKPDIIFSFDECIKSKDTIDHLLKNENMILYNGENHRQFFKDEKTDYHLLPSPSNTSDIVFSKPLLRVKQQEFLNQNISIKNQDATALASYLKDIILLDDRDDTSQFNINNLIQIPYFEVNKLTQKELLKENDDLKKLEKFFINLPKIDDIRDYLKVNGKSIFV